MRRQLLNLRMAIETVLALACGLFALAAAFGPQWIEAVFGVQADAGSGETEWALAVGLGLAAVVAVLSARHSRLVLRTMDGTS